MATPLTFDAIILCGGRARRLDGTDKAGIVVGGHTLLDRALAAVASADRIVAVGPERETPSAVIWAREHPPAGGPAHGIAAGLQQVSQEAVFVLGVDFPFVERTLVDSMVRALGDNDGVILADAAGRHQFLVGAYKRASLLRAWDGREPCNSAVKDLVAVLQLDVVVDPRAAMDCDTWADVTAAEQMLR